ncbi:MAG: prepilin peptidase [Proteobacteria bacterium]|nr:prepilin peptidase [Pseudomonadota bacterium]
MFILFFVIYIPLAMYIGSFITAIALRISNDESIFAVRSKCDSCGSIINFLHLIPIIGYIVCKGRCVSCRQKVSIEYTIWEMLHTMLYINNFIHFYGNIPALVCICGITSVLMMISIIDIKTMYIYDAHIIILFIFSILFFCSISSLNITYISFISGCIPLLFKVVYEFIRKAITGRYCEVLGMGDVKLLIVPFFFLDFYKITVLMELSGLAGVVYSGVLRGRKSNMHYPFAPSISVSIYGLFIWFL